MLMDLQLTIFQTGKYLKIFLLNTDCQSAKNIFRVKVL